MLTTLTVSGFRRFQRLRLSGLGRINVLVGENGAGKTSLLEALRLLGAGGNPAALWAAAQDRGEYDIDDVIGREPQICAELHFAFHGRQARKGARFVLEGDEGSGSPRQIQAEIFDAAHRDGSVAVFIDPKVPDPETPSGYETFGLPPAWALRLQVDGGRGGPPLELPLSWSADSAQRQQMMLPPVGKRQRLLARLPVLLRANGLDDALLARLWDEVLAISAKDRVIAALQRLEPSIHDLDLRSDTTLPFRSRVSLRLANGHQTRAPIGSLGEGVTWLFALALALAATPGRLLLVDDIDAGLHHRAMDPLWDLVMATARARDVQVFATTHSIDCLHALRRACGTDAQHGDDVRVVRLAKDQTKGITFTADELATAIDGEIEVRG